MFVIPLKYTNFEGKEVADEFAFHMDIAELVDIEIANPGGFEATYRTAIANRDHMKLLALLKDLMMLAVGRKSPNGKYFDKTDEIRKEFELSGAYSAMFVLLATGQIDPAKFFTSVMPKDLEKRAAEMQKAVEARRAGAKTVDVPALNAAGEARLAAAIFPQVDGDLAKKAASLADYSELQIREMSTDEFFTAWSATDKGTMPPYVMDEAMKRIGQQALKPQI